MTSLACIVTGDRRATMAQWWSIICNRFDWLLDYAPSDADNVVILHGDARGIDSLADQYFRPCDVTIERYPAQWTTHGKAAGPIRNQEMLSRLLALQAEGYRVGVMAFHNDLDHSKGTGHMVRIARAANVPVLTYRSSDA